MAFNFGSTAVAAPATSSGFNFGSTTATTPASSGFSFGGPSTSTTSTTPSSSFSFGGTATAPLTVSTQPSTTAFSFASTTTQPTRTSTTGFSFGSGTTAPTTTPSTSFSFGGGSGVAAPASTFGFGTTPSLSLNQPSLQPSPLITMDTVFNTLPPEIQKNITSFHSFLKEQDLSETFLKTVSSQPLDRLETSLETVQQHFLIERNRQDQQATSVHQVRKQVQQLIHQVDQATLTLRTRQGDATAQRNPYYGIVRDAEQPSFFYEELINQFENRMLRIKELIQVVESENLLSSQNHSTIDASQLQPLLVHQHEALVQMAGLVVQVHEQTEQMREMYLKKIKEDLRKHGDVALATFKNPFEKKKKKDSNWYEIDAIRFKTSVAPTIIQQVPPSTSNTGGFGSTAGGFGSTPSLFGTTGTTGTTGTSSLFTAKTPGTINTTPVSTSFSFNTGSTGPIGTSATPTPAPLALGGAKTVSFGTNAPPPLSTTAPSTSFSFTPTPVTTSTSGFGIVPSSTPIGGALGEKRTLSSSSGSGNKSSGGVRGRARKR